MNVLKGLALSLLNFLLFLSLAAFGMAFTLNSTLLNPEFVVSEMDKLDVSAISRELVGEYVAGQVVGQLPPELQSVGVQVIREAVYEVVDQVEPDLKEGAGNVIYAGYDFLLGKTDKLRAEISLGTFKGKLEGVLKETAWRAFQESVPVGLSGLSQVQIQQYFDQYFAEFYQEIARQIPSSLVIDESLVPPEVMQQLVLARQYIGYFRIVYYALMGFMLLLVLLIILINRNVRKSTRDLGITFLIYGAIEFTGVFLGRNFVPALLPLRDLPSSLQMWITGLSIDLMAPLLTFSIGVMVAGAVLLIISFVYRPSVAED